MKRKITIAALLIFFVLGTFAVFYVTDSGSSINHGKVTIKFASVSSSTHPVVVALNDVFKKEVEERSNGDIVVHIFDNGSLGEESAMMEQTQLGTIQMASISEVISGIDQRVNILNLPYIFENYEQADAVIDNAELRNELLSGLKNHRLVGLQIFENGFRVVTNSLKPVNCLGDIKGMKIRTPKTDAQINIFNAFGANVAPLNFNELYGALQQKVVDGQENGYNTIVTQSFYEVQPYLAETNHMWGSFVIIANMEWWSRLKPEHQEIIQTAIDNASRYEREVSRKEAKYNKQVCIDNGVQITTPDLKEFAEAVRPVYNEFYETHPELSLLVEKILRQKELLVR